MKKWEQRAIHMNFKKAVIIFLITCFVLMISVPAALYGNFQNRIAAWEQVRETDKEHREEEGLPYGCKWQAGSVIFQSCGSGGPLSLWYAERNLCKLWQGKK